MIAAPRRADPARPRPRRRVNYEIGAKADLFGRTAAADRRGVPQRAHQFPRRRRTIPPQPATLQVLDGRSRVDGIALGATGNITRPGRSSPTTPISTASAAERVGLLPRQSACLPAPSCRLRQHARRLTRSAGRPAADPDAEAFGQPVHHLSPAVRTARSATASTYQGSFALNNRARLTARHDAVRRRTII